MQRPRGHDMVGRVIDGGGIGIGVEVSVPHC
jgi:hypothetical protein